MIDMLRRCLVLACMLGFAVPGFAAKPPPPAAEVIAPALQSALANAAKRRLPTLVEFRAPWCYSCYYMARHVHTGAEWEALKRRAVVVELDADSPEGAAQMKAWNVKALPSYVVLDAKGREVGRVLGEHKREAFYARMETMLGADARLDDLRKAARTGGRDGVRATQNALAAFHARNDAAGGIEWFYDLPGSVRRSYEPDANVAGRLARLRLMLAAQSGDAHTCTTAAAPVFAADLACERPYELDRYTACIVEGVPDALMRAQLAPMEHLVESVLIDPPACADQRSAVLGLVSLRRQLGDAAGAKRLLQRAAETLRKRLGADLGDDRSAADNLRVYTEEARDWTAYDELMPRLIATWPEDYVYAFRYGRSLLERDRASQALPYLERAAAHAYGQNRLKVAEQRVKALKRLGQPDDARRVGAEALKANGPWFPELAAALKSQL